MRAGAPGCTSRGALVGPGANGIATARILASGSRRGATTTNARASRPSAVVAMPLAGPTRRAITAMTMEDEEGEISTANVSARFVEGKPVGLLVRHEMKSPGEWDRFMRFMERYAEANGLGFAKA